MNRKSHFQMLIIINLLALVNLVVAAESYVSRSVHLQDWYIGPQPSVADLEEMKSKGVSLVISTRLPAELEKLDFDEASAVQARGMQYLNIPVGGADHPFAPSMLETFSQAVAANKGPILMHCRSGYRVSVLAAAYLIKEQGMGVDAAIKRVGNQRVTAATVELLLTN